MAEEVTRVVENVDRLFSEIVVNGESHTSDRYVPPEPEQSDSPVTQNETEGEEENQGSTVPPRRIIEGEYVEAVLLNNTLHDLKDTPLTQVVNRMELDLEGLHNEVDGIEELIPNQASPSNQLADKDFVNSSISTNTANFLGTYTSMAQIEAIPNPTNNDYAFLQSTDSAGNTVYSRYKYNAEQQQWLFEYELNNSSFTAEQWATINSGLTQQSVDGDIEDAINDLDVAVEGGNGKYIKSISQVNGKIVAESDWLSATGGGVAFVGTRAQYEVAKLIPLGQTGHIPSGSLVIITDENDYLNSEDM
jgi:hypothetical protein